MATDSTGGAQVPEPEGSVIRWLLDSDPAIRWQVMQDLTSASRGCRRGARARRQRGGRRSAACCCEVRFSLERPA